MNALEYIRATFERQRFPDDNDIVQTITVPMYSPPQRRGIWSLAVGFLKKRFFEELFQLKGGSAFKIFSTIFGRCDLAE